MITVREAIERGRYGNRGPNEIAEWELDHMSFYLDQNAKESDGFGWVCPHLTDSAAVSTSGTHRCARRALRMKQCKPFTVVLVVWDYEKMKAHAKRYWHQYTAEERSDINEALAGYTLRTEKAEGKGRSSPFARWSQCADSPAPVDAGTESGGSDSSSAESCTAEQVIERLRLPTPVPSGGRWPFPV